MRLCVMHAHHILRPIMHKFTLLLLCALLSCTGHASNKFVVGLTDVSPLDSEPIVWKYALCGQYPGEVPLGATVMLPCHDNLPTFRYVVVHFPSSRIVSVCEIQVMVRGMSEMLAMQSIVQYRPCVSNSIGSICCGLVAIMLTRPNQYHLCI